MELEKFERQLKLIELLVGNSHLTLNDIANRLGLSKRTVYRYMELFKVAGFDVDCNDGIYCIEYSSPFLQRVSSRLRFTGNEMDTLRLLLEQADGKSQTIASIKSKIGITDSENVAVGVKINKLAAENMNALHDAIVNKHKVVLHKYFSPHSKTCSDRIVEPFKLLGNEDGVRCYEISTGMCKTFKMSRINGFVELLPEKWEFGNKHIAYHTDLFGFSGEKTSRVKLRMGTLATRMLMEEYGVKDTQLVIDDEYHNIFATSVCNYQGIGRFVMGLINDIEIIDSPGFVDYLRRNLSILTEKLAKSDLDIVK